MVYVSMQASSPAQKSDEEGDVRCLRHVCTQQRYVILYNMSCCNFVVVVVVVVVVFLSSSAVDSISASPPFLFFFLISHASLVPRPLPDFILQP